MLRQDDSFESSHKNKKILSLSFPMLHSQLNVSAIPHFCGKRY